MLYYENAEEYGYFDAKNNIRLDLDLPILRFNFYIIWMRLSHFLHIFAF